MLMTIEANRSKVFDLCPLLLLRLRVRSIDCLDTPRLSIETRPSSIITLFDIFWNCWSWAMNLENIFSWMGSIVVSMLPILPSMLSSFFWVV